MQANTVTHWELWPYGDREVETLVLASIHIDGSSCCLEHFQIDPWSPVHKLALPLSRLVVAALPLAWLG